MSDNIPERCTPAWAHAIGVIDLQPVAVVPTDLGEVADRLLIQETVARYAMAYDERRLDVMGSLYTETGTYRYRIGEGPVDGVSGRDNLLPWLRAIMESQTDQRRHMMSSLVIDSLSADQATVIAYKTIFGIETTTEVVATGLYRFSLVKRDGTWLIEEAYDLLDRPF
jgi:hypothetical protein